MAEVLYAKEFSEKAKDALKKELADNFKNAKNIAIKMHFGEPGNKTALKPEDIKDIIGILKELSKNIVLFDSEVSYTSLRNDYKTYKKYAEEKGFGKLGEIKTEPVYINVKGNTMEHEVSKVLSDADAVLVISHVKGHKCSGFGGAIKNLGMGALSKKTKQTIHANAKPVFSGECIQCEACVKACPLDNIAIDKQNKCPTFGQTECWGCSDCEYACPINSIKPKLNYFDILLAEGAYAAFSSFKKVYFISLLKNITEGCDCLVDAGQIIAKDAGILFSKDGVAIDKASHDLIAQNEKKDPFLKHNKKSGLQQIEAAEKLRMGKQDYTLKRV